MLAHTDFTGERNWEDVVQKRVRLPGYYPAAAAKYLYERAPEEFDAEQAGTDVNGQTMYVLFWHTPRGIV